MAPISYWHDSLAPGDDLVPRAPLPGDTDADVAVVGAGFTGLWTAHSLLRADPTMRVTVLEREVAGFGASGRNGGWCVGDYGGPVAAVERAHGAGSVEAMAREMPRSPATRMSRSTVQRATRCPCRCSSAWTLRAP